MLDSQPAVKSAIALRAVDFFCGPGGMSHGLQRAGISVMGGIDNDRSCQRTYESNIKSARFIRHDISSLSAPELGRRLRIHQNDRNMIFVGCSPCQFWSKIRTDRSRSEKTAFLLKHFEKFIRFFHPGFIVVENVPGISTRRIHSILPDFLQFLDRHGYAFANGIIDANHYGVPQHRMRYLLIASSRSTAITLPPGERTDSLCVSDYLGVSNGFAPISAGHKDTTEFLHTAAALSSDNLERIRLTPKSGGNRFAWKKHPRLQIPAYRGRDNIFRDVYGRMFWNRPAPTITTRFNSFSNGRFGHPDEDRAISLREGATLQTFPKDFVFHGPNQSSIARQIGNAVPPELAYRIGLHLISVASNG